MGGGESYAANCWGGQEGYADEKAAEKATRRAGKIDGECAGGGEGYAAREWRRWRGMGRHHFFQLHPLLLKARNRLGIALDFTRPELLC